ncbi:hypothetical protein QBE52_07800 [Clostridiaceae bacterium 35-E11]
MKIMKKHILLLLTVCIIFSASCTQKPQKPKEKQEDGLKPMPKVIEEIEKDTLKIMNQADMVPYFERVIVEKKKIEEDKKIEEMQMSKPAENANDQKPEEKPKEMSSSQEQPKPMTIAESILTDVLKREEVSSNASETKKPPKDIAEVWKKINTSIKGLHYKWNILEPLLIQQNITPETIKEFEDTLDNLTKYGIDQNYFDTLSSANRLTAYLPKFMSYFKTEISPITYTLKYHIRSVVLNSAIGQYSMAQEALNKMKEQSQSLKSELIEKKAKSTADKFDASILNSQKSLDKKDLNLIKINASIVMKNVMLMMEDLKNITTK